MQTIINISGYQFTPLLLQELPKLQAQIKEKALACNIKGTILLSTEGINVFVASTPDNINVFLNFLTSHAPFSKMHFKESPSQEIPFSRLLVRIKKEIIAMGCTGVDPEQYTANYLAPDELKQWYQEKRDFVVLDTRNDYEVALGSFDQAIDLNIENFREFPDAVALLPETLKEKPIVTFCTGGIRCEKAAAWMEEKGFKNVYQLKDGILNYFEKVGGDYYHGDCFVFDKRLTVNSELEATETITCYEHRLAFSEHCPYCQHIKTSRKLENQATSCRMSATVTKQAGAR